VTNRVERYSPAAGLLAVVLWIVGIIAVSHNQPSDHATDQQILEYVKDQSNSILLGGWLFMIGCLCFLWFASSLRTKLWTAEGSPGQFSTLAFTGAVAAAIFAMAVPGPDIAAAIDKDDISAATAGTLHRLSDAFFVGAELAAILLLVAVAVVVLRTRVLPSWWAYFGILLAIVLVIGPIGWAGLIFGMPVWIIGTSLMLLVDGRTHRPVTASPPA
jgi:uncharacterized protein DUF4386